MAQSVKYLLCKCEDLNLIPNTHIKTNKKQMWWYMLVIQGQENGPPQEDLGALLASQPSHIHTLQDIQTLSQKQGTEPEEWTSEAVFLPPNIHTCTCIHSHLYLHIPTHIYTHTCLCTHIHTVNRITSLFCVKPSLWCILRLTFWSLHMTCKMHAC